MLERIREFQGADQVGLFGMIEPGPVERLIRRLRLMLVW